jgi:pyridoxine 5-phosphate synthase
MVDFALEVRPQAVCVVPENRTEVTTEGGLDVVAGREKVRAMRRGDGEAGIEASLFIDPDEAQIELSAKLGAPVVELHTGAYSRTPMHPPQAGRIPAPSTRCGPRACPRLGLKVNAGHGINYVNIAEVRTLPHLHELNIGHSILSRALFTGIEEAVREMKARMNP